MKLTVKRLKKLIREQMEQMPLPFGDEKPRLEIGKTIGNVFLDPHGGESPIKDMQMFPLHVHVGKHHSDERAHEEIYFVEINDEQIIIPFTGLDKNNVIRFSGPQLVGKNHQSGELVSLGRRSASAGKVQQ